MDLEKVFSYKSSLRKDTAVYPSLLPSRPEMVPRGSPCAKICPFRNASYSLCHFLGNISSNLLPVLDCSLREGRCLYP